METKLTLTLDESVIEKAKGVAIARKTSVSKLVEDYLQQLTNNTNEYNNIWDDTNFVAEMDSRVESYENGTAKVFTFEEIKKAVVETHNAKKSTRGKYRIP